jgi:outer membrane receptor protein involved in Fe transport
MVQRSIIAILSLLIATSIHAQVKYSLSGKVSDVASGGIAYATIALHAPADSSIVKADYSDTDGTYELTNITSGSYILSVSMPGYATYYESMMIDINTTKDITLEAKVEDLKAVTVSAQKPYIERKIDRTIVNLDALLANAGSTAFEALERAPGVSTDNDGNIKLKGRSGVAIYIDDKPTYLSGLELENYLKSLPTGTIKHIEIMTNPPAKYEAAGNAGIINIVTKRNRLAGFFGNASANGQRSRFYRSNNSLNLNYTKNKVGLYANVNGGYRKSYQDLNINRYYKNDDLTPSGAFKQNSYIVKSSSNVSAKVGIDYYMTDKTTIGASFKTLTNPGMDITDNNAGVSDATQAIQRVVKAYNTEEMNFKNKTYNTYLRHLIDSSGSTITLDLDYVTYNSSNDQLFNNIFYTNNGTLTYTDKITGSLPSDISIYAAKTDYTLPINKIASFSAGLKTAHTKTNNAAVYDNTIAGVTTPDYSLTNKFLYDEWIHAAYINYTTKAGPIELQMGLRSEYTTLEGDQLGNAVKPGSTFNRNYLGVFPTLFASWNVDTAALHNLSFSYGRRIDRPYFQDLNPFVSPLDKFTFYTGNPNLKPTYTNNLSLTHSYKGQINTTLTFAKTTDGINETLEISDGIYYSRPNNITTQYTYGLSVEANIQAASWYTINAYTEYDYFQYKSKLYTEQLNAGGPFFYFQANNSFTLGKGWTAEVRGDYQSDIVVAQLKILDFGTLNLGFSKKIMKDAATIRLAVNDILHTRRGSGIINNLRLTDADWNSQLDTRLVSLTFTYRFGKSTSTKQKYKAGGSESEQQRVKG